MRWTPPVADFFSTVFTTLGPPAGALGGGGLGSAIDSSKDDISLDVAGSFAGGGGSLCRFFAALLFEETSVFSFGLHGIIIIHILTAYHSTQH